MTEKIEALVPSGPDWILVDGFSWKPTKDMPVSVMWENSTLQVRSTSSVIHRDPIGMIYYVSCIFFEKGSRSRRPSNEQLEATRKAYDLSTHVKEYVPSDDCIQRGFFANIPSRGPVLDSF